MPSLDGFAVLEELRPGGAEVSLIALTKKDLSITEQAVLREGFAMLLGKSGALQAAIDDVTLTLRQRREALQSQLPKVLYVEDVEQNRDIVRRYLAGLAEVYEAFDGEHGLRVAAAKRPDLIFMDLSLPRLDGWEATRRLKADTELRKIPVIALTAHASVEDREKARSVGCSAYLTKPIERQELLAELRRTLNQETDGV